MKTLGEIEAAAKSLPIEQKEELLRFLTAQIHALVRSQIRPGLCVAITTCFWRRRQALRL